MVFSRLSRYSLILDAEPQIGKTGAVLSMLEILYCDHIVRAPAPAGGPPAEHTLQAMTKRVATLINDMDRPIEDRLDDVREYYTESNQFATYHALLGKYSEARNLAAALVEWATNRVELAMAMDKPRLTVVDAGCGLHGMVHVFRQVEINSQAAFEVHVHGYDLDMLIKEQEADNESSTVKFHAHVADMIVAEPDEDLKDGAVDGVVYNLSLMETNVTRHIKRAHALLSPGKGTLVIADISSRFPLDFVDRLRAAGFSRKTGPVEYGPFTLFTFTRLNGDFIQPDTPIQLSLYI